jgi:hypothetical protein
MSGMVVVAISIVGVAFLTMFFVALCRESWKAKHRTLVLFDGGAALVEDLNEDSVEVRKTNWSVSPMATEEREHLRSRNNE